MGSELFPSGLNENRMPEGANSGEGSGSFLFKIMALGKDILIFFLSMPQFPLNS
jgi:hypothetical protein